MAIEWKIKVEMDGRYINLPDVFATRNAAEHYAKQALDGRPFVVDAGVDVINFYPLSRISSVTIEKKEV